jgi:hypothetical protein
MAAIRAGSATTDGMAVCCDEAGVAVFENMLWKQLPKLWLERTRPSHPVVLGSNQN